MSSPDTQAVPASCRAIHSIVSDDGTVTMSVHDVEVVPPRDHEVIVRIEAAPINPSDLGTMFAGADLSSARAVDAAGIGVRADLSANAQAAQVGRLGQVLPCGNEGGGVVVAAGASPDAQALLGTTVGFVSGNSYAEYRSVPVAQCFPMPEGTTPEQAAAPFVNPLTALGMVETMRSEGHSGLVHTVGASNLGLMLNRLCLADGVPVVNLVRRPEHVEILRGLGAEHVVDSSSGSFLDDLTEAVRATRATIAFDAIGGGELASTLLSCMERVAGDEGGAYSRYGSGVHKQVYIYGGLDQSPTVLRRDFGMSWGVGSWRLRPFLARIGDERAEPLRKRVASEITTTFASSYGLRLSLADAVDPDTVQDYGKKATGLKALVMPHAT